MENLPRPYTKLIVLTEGRTGSTLLVSLLNSHSQIFFHSEVFNENVGKTRWPNRPNIPSFLSEDQCKYLRERVFREDVTEYSVVGYKMMYYQARSEGREVLWSYLQNMKDLKIIHLRRENILNRIVSVKRAKRDKLWTTKNVVNPPPVFLSYESCIRSIKQTEQQQQKMTDFFRGHDIFDITYEQITNNHTESMNKLQRWLGVGIEPLCNKWKIKKMLRNPLQKKILNYNRLKAEFAKSNPEYLKFFIDELAEAEI